MKIQTNKRWGKYQIYNRTETDEHLKYSIALTGLLAGGIRTYKTVLA